MLKINFIVATKRLGLGVVTLVLVAVQLYGISSIDPKVYADDNFIATIISTPNEPTVDTTPTFQFSTTFDTESFTFQCYIDNLAMGDCVSPVTISPLDSGNHTFSVGMRDSFGNFSPVDSHTWTINTEDQGDGSVDYPLGITDCAGLQDIDLDLTAYYKLLNNIDCTGTTFTPIGDEANPFTGNFQGNGYTVSNIGISNDTLEATGLFSMTDGATISSLRIIDSNVGNTSTSGNYSIGGVVGIATDTILQDITSDNLVVAPTESGSISGYTGGLVGVALGTSNISKSYFAGSTTGLNNGTGGIAGILSDSSIVSNSYSDGIISGESHVGGLVGLINSTAVIANSYTAITFEGDPIYSGGIVGSAFDSASIEYSFSVANMQGVNITGSVGGIVGDAANPTVSITDTYFDESLAGRANCKGTGDATVSCVTTSDPNYFLGNDTNGPLAIWSQGNPWNLHEEGMLPTFSIGSAVCDDPPSQSESTLLFGCDWGRQVKHQYSGNAVSRDIRYRLRGSDDAWVYQDWPLNTFKVLITGLLPATDYEVQFHTFWEVGSSDWEQATGWLSTGADINLDSDGDGILDSVELNGPNYGDANGDGEGNIDYTAGIDSQQANVTSLLNSITGKYAVLQSDCTSNSSVSINTESSSNKDIAFDYSMGLMSFTATGCNATATFTQYFYGDYNPNSYTARKFNTTTKSYTSIPGAVLSSVTFNGQKALKIVYQIADNGPLDQDATTGTIVDPSGPAIENIGVPNTGFGRQ